MSEAQRNEDPLDRVVRLCELTDFDKSLKPTCHSCLKGNEDWDGDGCSQWYCGMECSERSGPEHETYLEDQGVDVDATHQCFVPDFWHTGFAGMLNGTKEMEEKAFKLYREAIEA